MRQRWKTVQKPRISVFWKLNRGNRVFGFWILRSVRFGSVFRKPISEIFIGFRTPLLNIVINIMTLIWKHLMSKPVTVRVHNSCRRRYTSKRRFEQASCNTHSSGELVQQKLLHSATNAFNWKEHCFFSAVLYAMIPISTSVALWPWNSCRAYWHSVLHGLINGDWR